MIGTHNSATGEHGKGLISWLLTPFARCQSKTIKQQYDAGCRYFDIRVRLDDKRGFIVAHGPWVCKRCAYDILSEIDSFPEQCWVDITYEGSASFNWFYGLYEEFKSTHKNLRIAKMCIKKPAWVKVCEALDSPDYEEKYIGLSSQHWQHWLPIPWLWDFIYFRNWGRKQHEFSDKYYTITDFL